MNTIHHWSLIKNPEDAIDRTNLDTIVKSARNFVKQMITDRSERCKIERAISRNQELRAQKIAKYNEKLNQLIIESNLELEGGEGFPTLEQWVEKNNEAVTEFRELKSQLDEIMTRNSTSYDEYERLKEQIKQLTKTRDELRKQLQQRKSDKSKLCLFSYQNSVAAVLLNENQQVLDCLVGKENIESKEDFWEDIAQRCLKIS